MSNWGVTENGEGRLALPWSKDTGGHGQGQAMRRAG